MKIVQLAHRPDLLPTVARWIFDQWWAKKPGSDIGKLETILHDHLIPDRVPLTLVALIDDRPAGTASLLHKDSGVEDRPETPWVAAVYTHPTHRNRGVAAALLDECTATAGRMHIPRIYLITEIPAFYERLGWKLLEKYHVDSDDDTIAYRDS